MNELSAPDQLQERPLSPCSQCGAMYVMDEMVEFDHQLVCHHCKPLFVQKIREGFPISTEFKRSKGWKVLFYILAVLQIISFSTSIKNLFSGEKIFSGLLDLAVYPWVLIAIFGYAYNRKILYRWIWKALFPITIASDVIAITIVTFAEARTAVEMIGTVVILLVFSPVFIFQYMALYRYGFSKIEPWID